MAIGQINAIASDQGPKKSKLETFGQVMGILTSLGGLYANAYNTFASPGAGAFGAKDMNPYQNLFGGLPKSEDPQELFNLYKDPNLMKSLDTYKDLYKNPMFKGFESSNNPIIGGTN